MYGETTLSLNNEIKILAIMSILEPLYPEFL